MNTNPKAKRILCYGDSFTWGYIPLTNHKRFASNVRWAGVLQDRLGTEYEVIEEGLNSRTLISEDTRSGKEGRKGDEYLIPCLDTHDPIDLVVLMLGTNELKEKYKMSAKDIASLLEDKFVKVVASRESQFRGTFPKVLIVAPPIVDETTSYGKERYVGGTQKAQDLIGELREVAKRNDCHFLSSNDLVETGKDGVHITEQSHKRLGSGIADFIREVNIL